MTKRNRKIRHDTYKHQNDPDVKYYNNLYHIGSCLIYKILMTFGDSKYSHNFCEYLMNRKQNDPNFSKYKFDELRSDFENGNHDIIIENKLNYEFE